MEKQVLRLQENQTSVTAGTPWRLRYTATRCRPTAAGDGRTAGPAGAGPARLFTTGAGAAEKRGSGRHYGAQRRGKSSLLRLLWDSCSSRRGRRLRLHPRLSPGYYDQTLHQLDDNHSLLEALEAFAPAPEARKRALISAGFGWARHGQKVSTLSGGERSRLLFVGLSLARYSLLLLDEPTNHLDMEGKEALADTLRDYPGGLLLVSHDRQLIARSCNRFWLIDDQGLSEWHDVDEVYARLSNAAGRSERPAQAPAALTHVEESDALLERLISLEQRLAEDMARKPKHQKPQQQARWQEEIAQINARLS
nr:glutathione-regulated potassium-efflux system ATP-binding protein [Raoultella sp. NCTC 9187]